MPDIDDTVRDILAQFDKGVEARLGKMHVEVLNAMRETINDMRAEMRDQFREIKEQIQRHTERLEEQGQALARIEQDMEHGEKRFVRVEEEMRALRCQIHDGAVADAKRDERIRALQDTVDQMQADSQRGIWFRFFGGRGPK
jgi:septal ring factor EnvC (AmiA/AmiB activator)